MPKLRLKIGSSPLNKLWINFKNAYVQMMVNFAGKFRYLHSIENVFGQKWVPQTRKIAKNHEVENRLVYEISKALLATRELSSSY